MPNCGVTAVPIRYHLDEHVDPAVALGLMRRGIDVTTTNQAGLEGGSDDAHLAFALEQRRVVFSQDDDFLHLAVSGVPHAGVIYNQQGNKSIGQIIEFLELVFACMTEGEMKDHVEFL